MASHKELLVEWTMLDGDYNNWTLQDLQLAAELGRTLLERNEELENELKQQQAVIEDQAQEIEFLTKQSASMKEQSENRAKFYEQLEQTIIELERTNTHLSRENEVDKKRIQSLCENIDYLERKCEEMTRALETIRDERAKRGFHGSRGKVNRGSYFNFGSDSSEEDNMTSGYGFGYGYGLFRRRSHSLQDLRDYTPSPDEFDSGNSNSPDLKTSESEYVESLENRIEELMTARKNETDKVRELESQIRLLIQENATLQTQLVQTSTEKDELIADLRRQLLDSGNYSQVSFNTSGITATSSRRNSSVGGGHTSSTTLEHEMQMSELAPRLTIMSPASPSCSTSSTNSSANSPRPSSSSNLGDVEGGCSSSAASTSSSSSSSARGKSHQNTVGLLNINGGNGANNSSTMMCKRCSAEVSILSLVNSIEVENDGEVNGGCFADFQYGVNGLTSDDHDMEFSSLEHELARATGASLPFDNRHSNRKSPMRSINRSALFPRHRSSIFQRDKNGKRRFSTGNISNPEIQLECEEELEYDENFELFLGHQPFTSPAFTRNGNTRQSCPSSTGGRRLFITEESSESSDTGGCSGSSTNDDEYLDLDEDPCLAKDRKPEISRSKKNSSTSSKKNVCKSSKKSTGSGCDSGCSRGMDAQSSSAPVSQEDEENYQDAQQDSTEELNVTFTSTLHSKLLELPTRIPSDEEYDDEDFEFDDDFDSIHHHAAKSCVPVSTNTSDAAIIFKDHKLVEGRSNNLEDKTQPENICQNQEPQKKTKCGIRESLSSSGYESSSSVGGEGEDSSKSLSEAVEAEKFDSSTESIEKKENAGGEVEGEMEKNNSEVNSEEKGERKEKESAQEQGKEECKVEDEKEKESSSKETVSSSSLVPEYKQILQNLFNLFNNSKRKYPIPLYHPYPYVTGQSSALIVTQSNNHNQQNSSTTTTSNNNNFAKNNNNGCSSH